MIIYFVKEETFATYYEASFYCVNSGISCEEIIEEKI